MLYRMKAMKDNGMVYYDNIYLPDELIPLPSIERSVKIEEFFPAETMMLVSIDTRNAAHRNNFKELVSLFPNGDFNEMTKTIIEAFDMEFEDDGLTYENDVKPIVSDSYRALMGISSYNLSQFLSPDVYFAVTINDKEKLESIINMLTETNPEYVKGNILGFNTLTNSYDLNLAYTDDVLLIASSPIARYTALRRAATGEDTLLENEDYMNSKASEYYSYIGSLFINFNNFMSFAGAQAELDAYRFLDYESIAFQAKDDGLNMFVEAAFDSEHLGFSFENIPLREPYMYESIPGNDLIAYFEGYSIKDIMNLERKLIIPDEDYNEFLDIFGKKIGLDFEEGILSWMSKGYAVVVQDNQGTFPAVSLYLDVNTNLTEARNAMDVFDMHMDKYIVDMKGALPITVDGDKVFTKEKISINGRTFHKVTIDYSSLTDAVLENPLYDMIPPINEITDDPVEFYYGITDKNYLVLTTYSDYDVDYNNVKSVKETPEIDFAMEHTTGYPYGLTYVSVENAMGYIDRLVSFMEEKYGPMGERDSKDYDLIMDYLAPIKYMVGGNAKIDDKLEGMIFIRMGN